MCSAIQGIIMETREEIILYSKKRVSQLVKNLLLMQETSVQALWQEDPLGKEVATLSSIFA